LFVRPRDPEQEIWSDGRAGIEGAKSEFGADESFPIEEFEGNFRKSWMAPKNFITALGAYPRSGPQSHSKDCQMRALNRKPIHPPRTIIDSRYHRSRDARLQER